MALAQKELPIELLNTFYLKDLVPTIDRMVNDDCRQSLRIKKSIREIATRIISGDGNDIKYYKMSKVIDDLFALFVKNYGSYFSSFLEKSLDHLVKKCDFDDYKHKLYLTGHDVCDISIFYEGAKHVHVAQIGLNINDEPESGDEDQYWRYIEHIVLAMGMDENFYDAEYTEKHNDLNDYDIRKCEKGFMRMITTIAARRYTESIKTARQS